MSLEWAVTPGPNRRNQPDPERLVWVLQSRSGDVHLWADPSVHGTTFPQMADATSTASWHGVQTMPDAYLCETLGLYQLPTNREALLNAKA